MEEFKLKSNISELMDIKDEYIKEIIIYFEILGSILFNIKHFRIKKIERGKIVKGKVYLWNYFYCVHYHFNNIVGHDGISIIKLTLIDGTEFFVYTGVDNLDNDIYEKFYSLRKLINNSGSKEFAEKMLGMINNLEIKFFEHLKKNSKSIVESFKQQLITALMTNKV